MPLRYADDGTDIRDGSPGDSVGTGSDADNADVSARALDFLYAVLRAIGDEDVGPGRYEANGTSVQDRENSWTEVATGIDSTQATRIAKSLDLRYALRRVLNVE